MYENGFDLGPVGLDKMSLDRMFSGVGGVCVCCQLCFACEDKKGRRQRVDTL